MKVIAELEHFHHEAFNKQDNIHTFSRKAIISIHSLGKAFCSTSVDNKEPEKKNS
jgi:hypothetical protein